MKILLLGEFSGLHLNLRDGLREHGHEVNVASMGDSWKKIPADIPLTTGGGRLVDKIQRAIMPITSIRNLVGYDVIQFMNPQIVHQKFHYNKLFIDYLIKNNGKSFFLAAGCDTIYHDGIKKLNYSPCNGCKSLDLKTDKCQMEPFKDMSDDLFSKADGIIPTSYEYHVTHSVLPNCTDYVPFPINLSSITYRENLVSDKLSFFHGLSTNREGFKGTNFIRESFHLMNKKHYEKATFLIKGGMPLKEYMKLIDEMHVVLDQTNCYAIGMNALFSMALGKAVIGGSEKVSNKFQYSVDESPVINTLPEVASISNSIEFCLDNIKEIPEWGFNSREFVRKYHDHYLIAEKFVDIYKNFEK